jgi:hypothetical protein
MNDAKTTILVSTNTVFDLLWYLLKLNQPIIRKKL